MNKKELTHLISDILLPLGFKKKGNYWVTDGSEISKMINLQKSQFSDSFYINYGYILNAILLDGMTMHVFNRLASTNSNVNNKIENLLNLENKISDVERTIQLKDILLKKLVDKINSINTEKDILEMLKKLPHLNNIPLIVKQYFNL